MEFLNKSKKEIDELDQRFSLILENYVDEYVSYLREPNNSEYTNNMNHINSVIENINSQGFLLKNRMEKELVNIENRSTTYNNEINVLKQENKALKEKVKILDEDVLTADGLFDNEIELYKKQIVTIIILVIGLIVISKLYYDLKLNMNQNMKVFFLSCIIALVVYLITNFKDKIVSYYNGVTKLT